MALDRQHRGLPLAPLNTEQLPRAPLADVPAGSTYSPLETLGRRVGLARSDSLQVRFSPGPCPSPCSRSTRKLTAVRAPTPDAQALKGRRELGPPSSSRPVEHGPAAAVAGGLPLRPSPLVFSAFRRSRASSAGSTDYTASVYSTASGDVTGYWAGPDLSGDNDDHARDLDICSDGERTERGDNASEPDDDDNDGDGGTELGHHLQPGWALGDLDGGRNGGLLAETSFASSDFTTSSRLSRFLDDSLSADPPPARPSTDPNFGPPHHDGEGSGSGVSGSRSDPSLLLPQPSSSFARPRKGSVGAVAQRTEGAVDVESVYGLAGGTWQQASALPPSLHPSESNGGDRQRTVSNFSRPRLGGIVAGPSRPAAPSPADYVPRPQRSASLRHAPQVVARPPASRPEPSRSTLSQIQPFRLSTQPTGLIPFPHQDSPPPRSPSGPPQRYPPPSQYPASSFASSSGSTGPAPAGTSIPPAVLLPSQNLALHHAARPLGPTEPQRPSHQLRTEYSTTSAAAAASSSILPNRRAPPPPVDRPAYNRPADQPPARTQMVRLPSKGSSSKATGSRLLRSAAADEPHLSARTWPNGADRSPPAEFEPPPPTLRIARQGSGESLHPGSYSIYSLPTTPTQPGGYYTKVEVGSPLGSPSLQPLSAGDDRRTPSLRLAQQQQQWPRRQLDPQHYLELGLSYFARDKTPDNLALAAMYWRSAATIDGGCSGGMLL